MGLIFQSIFQNTLEMLDIAVYHLIRKLYERNGESDMLTAHGKSLIKPLPCFLACKCRIKHRRSEHYERIVTVPEKMIVRILLADIIYSCSKRPPRLILTEYSLNGSVIIKTCNQQSKPRPAVREFLQILKISVPVEKAGLLIKIQIGILQGKIDYAHGKTGKSMGQQYPGKEHTLQQYTRTQQSHHHRQAYTCDPVHKPSVHDNIYRRQYQIERIQYIICRRCRAMSITLHGIDIIKRPRKRSSYSHHHQDDERYAVHREKRRLHYIHLIGYRKYVYEQKQGICAHDHGINEIPVFLSREVPLHEVKDNQYDLKSKCRYFKIKIPFHVK